MNALIAQAIEEKRRLRFRYNDKGRLVEPQCYGRGSKGAELLRAYQIEGGDQREPLFDVARISELTLLDERFDQPGPNYKRNVSAMQEIFRQL